MKYLVAEKVDIELLGGVMVKLKKLSAVSKIAYDQIQMFQVAASSTKREMTALTPAEGQIDEVEESLASIEALYRRIRSDGKDVVKNLRRSYQSA
ncbi:MAG: hypothetical protein Q8R37_03880 [Nanoarchaeota archaeon]|nr:hypothetical protein [Nanoarchaeota archaeon]